MDVLKAQLDRIVKQLAGLSASQRMLVLSLVAIMVMTLLYWARYAGTAEMVEVSGQSLAGDSLLKIENKLRAEGVNFTVAGDRVLVPLEQQYQAVAMLMEDQLLPRDSSGGFDSVLNKLSPFASADVSARAFVELRQSEIARVIRQMKGVADATVLLDTTDKQRVEGSIEPKASVWVKLRDGVTPDKKFAEAIAAWVDGSTSNLKRGQIRVIINDRLFPVHDPSAGGAIESSGELADAEWNAERHAVEKIQSVLGYFGGGVLANVRVRIGNERTQTEQIKIDDVKQKELQTDTESEEQHQPQAPPNDPGFASNSGLQIPTTPAPGSGDAIASTKTREKTQFQNLPSQTVKKTDDPGGQPTIVSATVNVPRSYYVRQLQFEMTSAGNKSAKPDEKTINDYVAAQLVNVRAAVKGVLGIDNAEAIHVSDYPDLPVMMAAISAGDTNGGGPTSGGGGALGSTTIGATVTNHARELAIGGLAVVSLFMVLMMVRKSGPVPVMVATAEPQEPVHLPGGEPVAGEVGEGNPMLDGMELDEDAIKAQQMVEQVSTMVKENPEAAASLIKRWMNRS